MIKFAIRLFLGLLVVFMVFLIVCVLAYMFTEHIALTSSLIVLTLAYCLGVCIEKIMK
jgi:hypothetical protein